MSTTDLCQQWAVADDRDRIVGLGRTLPSLEEAQAYLDWLTGDRRRAMQEAAEENERSGFEDGNADWYHWNVGSGTGRDGGEKARRYRIVTRWISPWTDHIAASSDPSDSSPQGQL